MLGPAGIGLLGILNAIMSTACTVIGLGLSNSGVRQVAEAFAERDYYKLSSTKRGLFSATIALGILGGALTVFLQEFISKLATGNEVFSRDIAWLGIGIFAATISASLAAWLNGLRRLGDLTRINVIGSIAAMAFGIVAVWLWGMKGIAVAVIAVPLSSLSASWYYAARTKIPTAASGVSIWSCYESMKRLFVLGLAFCATSLMTVGTQFVIRVIVTRELGIDATGHFQAAWNISVLYLGFVLGAMGTDYYPRLTAVACDTAASNEMMNEQAEVALLLSGPVILAMLTLTPWLIALFYSEAFVETTAVLRWQILGDIFKVTSWSLAFLFLAQARTVVFFLTELAGNLVYIGCVWFGLAVWGLEATGIGFLICYFFYF